MSLDGTAAWPVVGGERPFARLRTADERSLLDGMLDWYRHSVVVKVRGVPQEVAGATPLPSPTSIAGLVKHLALVEDAWYTEDFAGLPIPEPWAGVDWDADRDWEFHTAVDEPIEDLLRLYEAACERSRQIAAGHHLDDVGADDRRGAFTLRWVHVHMIEETARHLGHLDILLEQLDGRTGD